jgi:hypothetical protein
MKALKAIFEAGNPGVAVNLVSGRSQELAERRFHPEPADPGKIKPETRRPS